VRPQATRSIAGTRSRAASVARIGSRWRREFPGKWNLPILLGIEVLEEPQPPSRGGAGAPGGDRVRGPGWKYLGYVTPNPALQNNRCHTFLATGAYRAGDPSFDPYERIVVELLTRGEAARALRDSKVHHGLVLAPSGATSPRDTICSSGERSFFFDGSSFFVRKTT